ncbi:MAG: TIGR00730 family Rossman fold protein [Azospirillaceae bacterium]
MSKIRSVCVYCGSSSRVDQAFKDAASALGRSVAARGMRLVYGGGRVGLMGLAADACLAAGGQVIGIIPGHIQELEVEHHGLTELHVVDSMHTRKRMMFDESDGFVILPGGLGTLDEMFEIITWRQLALHDKPIVLANIRNYWDPVLALLEHQIEIGFCRPEHRGLFRVEATVEAALDALEIEPEPQVPPQTKWI